VQLFSGSKVTWLGGGTFQTAIHWEAPCDKIANHRGNQIIRRHRWNCESRVFPDEFLS